MIFSLSSAVSTVDLPSSEVVIELAAPPLSNLTNYQDAVFLVDHEGDFLVNQDGDFLIYYETIATRTNIVDLGA